MRLRRIAFALSSCTKKARTERLDADDSMSFIPISIPSSYPVRIPLNKGILSSYARSLSSLTRLERSTRIPETPGCIWTRRNARGKRVPFLRCNTLSTMNLRTATSSGSDLAPSAELNRNLIGERARSVRTLTTEDVVVKKESSRDRLSKQIRHLRGKFDSVGEENHPVVRSDSDANLTRSFPMKREQNETKTSVMAALLIGSIRHMPLENVGNDDLTLISPSEQSMTTNDDEASGECCRENPQENADVKDEGQRQDNASLSVDETEMSSFDDDDDDDVNDGNSSDDESSNGTASYNILDDSRSLDGGRDSSSLQETIPITVHSSAESCTDSTLQVESDVVTNRQSSSNPEDIKLQNDAIIPVITVNIHENADSDTSIDAIGLSNDESSNITISHSLAKSETFVPTTISSSDEREVDDAIRKTFGTFEKLEKLYHSDDTTFGFDNSLREMIERSAPQFDSSSPAETEDHRSADREERNDPAIDLPPASESSRASLSKEELRARAIVAVRRRCMHDLIQLIDTKMIVSTHHRKKTISLKSKKRKKRERRVHKRVANTSENNSLEKVIPSRGTLTRRQSRRRRRGNDVPLPRVRSSPDYLSSQPLVPILHVASRSCGSSLVNLTDRPVVSRGSKRVALLPPTVVPGFDLDSAGLAISVNGNCTRKRTTSTICNLERASCHIDRTKPTNTANITHNTCVSRPSPDLRQQDEASVSPSYPLPAVSSMTVKMSQSPATRILANVPLHRRSSDSDLSVTPKGKLQINKRVPIINFFF